MPSIYNTNAAQSGTYVVVILAPEAVEQLPRLRARHGGGLLAPSTPQHSSGMRSPAQKTHNGEDDGNDPDHPKGQALQDPSAELLPAMAWKERESEREILRGSAREQEMRPAWEERCVCLCVRSSLSLSGCVFLLTTETHTGAAPALTLSFLTPLSPLFGPLITAGEKTTRSFEAQAHV